MNYCSLEDAWGKSFEAHQTESFADAKLEKKIEPSYEHPLIRKDNDRLEHVKKHMDELYGCQNFLNHIRHCRKCHNMVKASIKDSDLGKSSRGTVLLEKFEEMVDDNKDSIVLILTGVFIILFFNLVNNVTKN